MSILIDLLDYGQSYWLDNLSRRKIIGGELKKRGAEEGLRGVTSNPSIFNEAITGSTDYDKSIQNLVLNGKSPQEIYDELTIKDVQDACDILEPVFKKSKGSDGFVSLEVAPGLARDTNGTILEARRLYKAVARKNCMIKIPGTIEGLPAIEQMLYEGININVTLLFSIERYEEVANVYIRALKRRLKEGKKIANIASVASFFLSRIDTLTDSVLSQYTEVSTPIGNTSPLGTRVLFGKAGVASAVLAYQRFKEIVGSKEWKKLEANGAKVQRLLWASTSNKDLLVNNDLRYVEPLIAPNTVNTLPDSTIAALADHGELKENTIEQNIQESKHVFSSLAKLKIDVSVLTQQLENEGVQKFTEAYQSIMNSLATRRLRILEKSVPTQKINATAFQADFEKVCKALDERQASARLFARDAGLWKTEKEQVKTIQEGLGWLTLPDDMLPEAEKFTSFASQIKKEGYTSVVLLGMGGSSLCSEVARETFGSSPGYPKLYVLDNTEPAAIRGLEKKINLEKTLFIVASKSGSTLETNCFFRYFYDKLEKAGAKKPGENFVAITDKGTNLVKIAADCKFRKAFINAPNVGGRYSVLSDFGILPMALVGIDVKAILHSAKEMMLSCGPDVPAASNPGISLGALLGIAQRKKHDKITFVLSPSLKSFGYWVEQLIAESTGKEGKGLIPVNGEELDNPKEYAYDRVFVHMSLASDSDQMNEQKLKLLEDARHPIVRIRIPDKIALGGVYYLWEIATAIAGMVIGINPFDQPNVAESKENTNNILAEWIKQGTFQHLSPLLDEEGIKLYGNGKAKQLSKIHHGSVADLAYSFIRLAKLHDYIAILPYFSLTPERSKIIEAWRESLKSELQEATTLLNGPRYLHSTGQLHKGGPNSGLYIMLIEEDSDDVLIPGQKYSFATLHKAQALGDYRSLLDKDRRVILIDLGKDIDKSLEILWESIVKEIEYA